MHAQFRTRTSSRKVTLKASDVRDEWAYHRMKPELIRSLGGFPLRLPYSDIVATSQTELDIDHLVPIEEAILSGAEKWTEQKWREFQSDLMNLVPSLPKTNRWAKGAKGVGEWVPPHHRRWYVMDYVKVKMSYALDFSTDETARIRQVLVEHPDAD